ncbi:hypothetical protein L7F22_055672 [Adiantum nelumboides]|nr:hypothetical protein [Adiantum nelumboides]
MAFPNFFGKQYESASNFLDDLEMAFLVSWRDEEEVKLRAFPLVLKDSAKNWFQNLEPGRKTNWETLKETFLSKYGGLDNPEHLWHRISSLHQATSRTYLTYESQFLRLWAEWEASLAEGERAPNFLKKEKFLAGLFPDLQEKVKGKFPETFEEALQIARVKDRKLEYQAHTSRVEHPQGPTMADERLPPAPTTTLEDPHLELLQRVTNQLDNLSINMVQGVRQQQPQPNNERMPNGPRRQPQRRDYFCYNCGEEGHGMYFCPHPRNFNAQAGRGRQQVTPPRARPPPQIQPQILQNPQMVAQPQVLQRSVAPPPVAEIPPLPNNNARLKDRKLQFERSWRDHSQAASSITTQEQAHPLLLNGSGDPYLDRLRRVTKQLDSLSINHIHGLQPEQPKQQQAGGQGRNNEVPRREYQCHNYGEDEHGMYFCPYPRGYGNAPPRGPQQQVSPLRMRPPPMPMCEQLQQQQPIQILRQSTYAPVPKPSVEVPSLPHDGVERAINVISCEDKGEEKIMEAEAMPGKQATIAEEPCQMTTNDGANKKEKKRKKKANMTRRKIGIINFSVKSKPHDLIEKVQRQEPKLTWPQLLHLSPRMRRQWSKMVSRRRSKSVNTLKSQVLEDDVPVLDTEIKR